MLKVLGQGATVTVFLAEHSTLKRQVALKVMATELTGHPELLQRFKDEGAKLARLVHPHIVGVYDSDVFGTTHYLAMEYIGGGSLRQRIGELTPDAAVAILCQLARALDYAHRHGIVHRDVKPANILFREDGTAVLSDFGIAKALAAESQLTAHGVLIGTLQYMSPEQAQGISLDGRSDLYSLGMVFFEMLTGRPPYDVDAGNPAAAALRHLQSAAPRLPAALSTYQIRVDRLLAKDPQDWFQTAAEVVAAGENLRGRHAPEPDEVHQEARLAIWRPSERVGKSRRRLAIGAWGLTLLLLGWGAQGNLEAELLLHDWHGED